MKIFASRVDLSQKPSSKDPRRRRPRVSTYREGWWRANLLCLWRDCSSSAETARPLTDEQSAECLAELTAHGAVDEEVEEVAEEDAQVDDARGDWRRTLVENLQLEDVVEDQHHEDDRHRELDEQEDADDDDQHQSGRVALGQSAELGASMIAQQSLAATKWVASSLYISTQ